MAKTGELEIRTASKTQLVEQISLSLRSGDYSRALDLVRGAATEFPNDAELAELEKRSLDGVKRLGEANRLITESQDLFAQQKSAEALQFLRKAYELDKHNSLARTILANALVEHAHSMVENDWLEAETLTNQALNLNPAHPTAKTIRTLIVDKKTTSSVDEWVDHARKRQSSGDLFAALAWVAEGLAIHPDDSKLLQIQDEIQRDQAARRRQARRGDVEDLRRMEQEINKTSDAAAKQALAERIQMVAAKHWTDGEILSIANTLLLRLGLVPKGGAPGSPQRKGATVIFHVPRPSAPETSTGAASPASTGPAGPNPVVPKPVVSSQNLPADVAPAEAPQTKTPLNPVPPRNLPATIAPPSKPSASIAPSVRVPIPAGEPQPPALQATLAPATETVTLTSKVPSRTSQPRLQQKNARKSNSTTLILAGTAAVIMVALVFLFARKHAGPPVANTPAVAPSVVAPATSTPLTAPTESSMPQSSTPDPVASAGTAQAKIAVDDQPSAGSVSANTLVESVHNLGSLLVVAGQDNAQVFLDGKLQRQLTQGGQLRLTNLEAKDYVVQVSKSGFQDPAQQKIRIRAGEQAGLIFNLQPVPLPATLTIRGGVPGTTVLVDQTPVGIIQPDGSLSISSVSPGDHTLELRKDRFKPRQFKEHFVPGGNISLAAADAALDAAPGELRITFAPADAKVAIARTGELPTMVSSGVPLNLVAGTYTLTARTAERFTRSSTFEIVAGQSKTMDLSLAPNGMSKWEDPGAWKHEGDSFLRQGGDFVLYGVVPSSGSFAFSATVTKGRLLQWVFNYTDSKNYVLFRMDDNNFYRAVIRNGQKAEEIIVPDKSDKKNSRTLHIRVSSTEIVHQVGHGDSWRVLDRWTQPGANLSLGKFGLYLPGNDQVSLSGFAHYSDLNLR